MTFRADASKRNHEEPGLIAALVGDGRPLLALLAVGLIVSGIFALFLSATNTFLPQDVAYLGMDREALCSLHGCRVVHFMFHDRVSFGGTLIAVGTLYLWLQAFPLRQGEPWAWWTIMLSSLLGFASFFAYLLFGYLDTWHATASSALLVLWVGGMWRTRSLLCKDAHRNWKRLWSPCCSLQPRAISDVGRLFLLATGLGMMAAGSVITVLGSTIVFVPQDIVYFGFTRSQLAAINPHLVPLIAHDRAGFGGGLVSCGLCVFLIVWKASPTRALRQALLFAGLMGFGCAIGIHYPMGYRSPSHLAPAWVGALLFATGVSLYRQKAVLPRSNEPKLTRSKEGNASALSA